MADIAINPVTRRVQFTGNTGTGPFAFTFNVLQQSDIVVYKNNVELTLTTDYTVSLNANGTGSVTLITALVATDVLVIVGGRELSRTTDFVTAGDLLASSLNEQLDSNVIMSQQLDERVSRTIRSQPGDELQDLYIPLKADRADKLLSFDTEGNVQAQAASDLLTGSVLGANYTKASHTGDGTTVAFSTTNAAGSKNNIQVYIDGVYQNKDTFSISGATLTFSEAPPLNSAIEFIVGNAVTSLTTDPDVVTYNQGGTGAQDRTLTSRLQDFVSVKDFGAVGDGVADDTAAIQAAIDYTCVPHTTTDAYLQAKKLTFPEGVYIVTKPLVIYGENFIIDGNNATIRKTTNDLPSSTLADQNMNTGGTIDPNVNAVFTTSSKVRYATIKNLNIEGLSGTSTPTGMYIYGNENLLQDIRFRDVNVGLHVPEMWTSRVEHVVVRGAASHGIWWDRTRKTGSASSSGTSINFSNCHLFDIGGIGYYFNAIFYATTNAISCDDFEQAYLFQGCFGLNAHFGFESQKTSSTENAVQFTSDTNGQATLDTYDPTAFSQASIYCSGAKIKLFGRLRVNNTVFIQAANDAIVDAKSLFIYPVSGDEYGTSRFVLDDNTSHIYYQPVGVIDGGQYPTLHYSSYGETRSADGADYLVSNLTGGAVPSFQYGQNKLRVVYAVTDFDTTYNDQIVVPLSEIDKVIPRYDENSWTGTLLGLRITERGNIGVGNYVSIQNTGSGPVIVATGQRAYTTVGTALQVAVTSITIVGTNLVIQLDVTGGTRQNVSCEIYPLT